MTFAFCQFTQTISYRVGAAWLRTYAIEIDTEHSFDPEQARQLRPNSCPVPPLHQPLRRYLRRPLPQHVYSLGIWDRAVHLAQPCFSTRFLERVAVQPNSWHHAHRFLKRVDILICCPATPASTHCAMLGSKDIHTISSTQFFFATWNQWGTSQCCHRAFFYCALGLAVFICCPFTRALLGAGRCGRYCSKEFI
jgi:hypothetical protein